jgi:hypothetical protein
MDIPLISLAIVSVAALLESVRQAHFSAIPLFLVVCVLAYYIVYGRRNKDQLKMRKPVPKLERIPTDELLANKEKIFDEFEYVALPTSDIYFVPALDALETLPTDRPSENGAQHMHS